MATNARDAQLAADLAAERRSNQRQAYVLSGVIGLIGAMSAVGSVGGAANGEVAVIGQGLVGLVGVAAAILMIVRPRQGWLLAMAWALIQIPFYAWTPDGSLTAQVIQLPITMTQSSKVNGELTSYSSIGINLAGAIFAVWLRAWRLRFEA